MVSTASLRTFFADIRDPVTALQICFSLLDAFVIALYKIAIKYRSKMSYALDISPKKPGINFAYQPYRNESKVTRQ
jgi:hypothetical protein